MRGGVRRVWLHIDTAESGSTAYDKLTVQAGSTTLATYSNLNAARLPAGSSNGP